MGLVPAEVQNRRPRTIHHPRALTPLRPAVATILHLLLQHTLAPIARPPDLRSKTFLFRVTISPPLRSLEVAPPSGEARPNPSLPCDPITPPSPAGLAPPTSPSPAGLAARRRSPQSHPRRRPRPRRRTPRPPSPSPQRPSQPGRWTFLPPTSPSPAGLGRKITHVCHHRQLGTRRCRVLGFRCQSRRRPTSALGIRWSARHMGGRRTQTRCSLFRRIRRFGSEDGKLRPRSPWVVHRPVRTPVRFLAQFAAAAKIHGRGDQVLGCPLHASSRAIKGDWNYCQSTENYWTGRYH